MEVNYNSITGIPTNAFDYGSNPMVLLVFAVIIILYYILFASLGGRAEQVSTGSKSGGIVFLEVLLWGVFLALLLLNGLQYFFNVNVTAQIKNLFTDQPEIDITVEDTGPDAGPEPVPELRMKKQVYHVPGNEYTYENAKALCKAYGSRLANYDELEKTYNEGGQWCSFGWSDDQMALYPTQKKTWEHLQKIKGHEHDCGRPGINGGFIGNPNVKFGVNCYGYKPEITGEEAELMRETPLYPKTMKDIKFQKRVDYWRDRLGEILVAPFNHNVWSLV